MSPPAAALCMQVDMQEEELHRMTVHDCMTALRRTGKKKHISGRSSHASGQGGFSMIDPRRRGQGGNSGRRQWRSPSSSIQHHPIRASVSPAACRRGGCWGEEKRGGEVVVVAGGGNTANNPHSHPSNQLPWQQEPRQETKKVCRRRPSS